jgi:hypothetical protein
MAVVWICMSRSDGISMDERDGLHGIMVVLRNDWKYIKDLQASPLHDIT